MSKFRHVSKTRGRVTLDVTRVGEQVEGILRFVMPQALRVFRGLGVVRCDPTFGRRGCGAAVWPLVFSTSVACGERGRAGGRCDRK